VVPRTPRLIFQAVHSADLGEAYRLAVTGDAGWIDLALGAPTMDIGRAHRELGWSARRSSLEALAEPLNGLRRGRGFPTPPLATDAGGPARLGELATGIGSSRDA
jgi:hypothetical protein